ncbi:MAG: outer membrane protein transport protein [Myxococcales bacterium]|nr:outer membrane protein transport protein [Myxococcales bacterium]
MQKWRQIGFWYTLLLVPATALAGGFEVPDNGTRAMARGGAFTASANDLTAIHYNPGALARLRGSHFMWHHNLVFHSTEFDRAPLSAGWGTDVAGKDYPVAKDSENLFGIGGFIVVASDFGLKDWMFALGVYGPSAVGKHNFKPYGPASFMMTELDVMLLYYSAAVAWQIPDTFGIGITLQYVDMPSMRYGLVVDSKSASSLEPEPDRNSGTQVEATLDLQDRVGFTAQIGAWWRPHPAVEIGLAGRVVPIYLSPEGGVEIDKKDDLIAKDLKAKLELTLPMTLRGGIRYIHEEEGRFWFDIEADVFWESWSSIDAYNVELEGTINGLNVTDLSIPKAWKDTVSVRVGGDINVIDQHLQLRAGGFWENGAVPDNYSHVDFASFDRFGVGGGLTGSYGGVSLSVGYLHVFQEDREVSETFGKTVQQRPIAPCPDGCKGLSGVIANAGKFSTSFDILSIGLDLHFSEWF